MINPASGKDEPILNILNDALTQHGVDWDISATEWYGDATMFAREAAESDDYDLIADYVGDGTQHEIANGNMGTNVPMSVLACGTGNGFREELGKPKRLRPVVKLLCSKSRLRQIDTAQLGDD